MTWHLFKIAGSAVACLLVGLGCAPPEQPVLTSGSGNIKVQVLGFRNDSGHAIVSLFNQADGFPDEVPRSLVTQTLPIVDARTETVFKGLPYARYAVSVLHDEDDNGQMKTGWLGAPLEGFGFSGKPDYSFGPPEFQDVTFLLVAPERDINIKLRYTTGRQEHQEQNRARTLNRPAN